MPKKSGLFALLTGVAAGAAAVFFAKKENRKLAQKELAKASVTATKVTRQLAKNPTVKKSVSKVKKVVKTQTASKSPKKR